VINREQPEAFLERKLIFGLVLRADLAPIAAGVALECLVDIRRVQVGQGARRDDGLPQRNRTNRGFCFHVFLLKKKRTTTLLCSMS
jgi:hypothetical protein